jgi:hypothetical protein
MVRPGKLKSWMVLCNLYSSLHLFHNDVKSEVLDTLQMSVEVFRPVSFCNRAGGYHPFGGGRSFLTNELYLITFDSNMVIDTLRSIEFSKK